ncbi:hypothetical protein [Bifidobacterium parmae]|uniref:Hrf1 family protein n=1 Tax=Bifidobacterium parmae TaxID=361854 RepID=A0A2N5J6I9_9BIFI|nr:hypothetical protein [Bifidobacterium parmae]PLS29813.1 Hrf1 family protein [Bifidobacterium parmae]
MSSYDNAADLSDGDEPYDWPKDDFQGQGSEGWRLVLFMRYVLVGRLEDGAQVFWDTREKTPVKRVLDLGGGPGWAQAGAAAGAAAAGAVPGLMVLIHEIGRLLAPEKGTHHTSTVDDVTLLAFLKPITMDRNEWNTYVAAVAMWLVGFLLYWCFCRLVFGRATTYVPASLEELAFASSMPATQLRYMFGGPIVGTLFLIGISWFPVCLTEMFWSSARNLKFEWSGYKMVQVAELIWMCVTLFLPILLALRFVGPWDWRGRFNLHEGAERRSRLR